MTQATTRPTSSSLCIEDLIQTLFRFRSMSPQVDHIAQIIIAALKSGRKVLTCGNGGSAADALHMSEELIGRYKYNRRALPAVSLAADPTALTCIGNDYGYEQVFARQVEGLASEGDVLVAFSSSGNSPNLLAALDAAKKSQVVTVALLGKDGGLMAGMADYELVVPSFDTARVQEIHTLILHAWLEQIDIAFFN